METFRGLRKSKTPLFVLKIAGFNEELTKMRPYRNDQVKRKRYSYNTYIDRSYLTFRCDYDVIHHNRGKFKGANIPPGVESSSFQQSPTGRGQILLKALRMMPVDVLISATRLTPS